MSKWTDRCIAQMPGKRILIDNSRGTSIIREIDPELEVLPLHEQFQEVSDKNIPSMVGYYHYKPQTEPEQEEWIPLLPGYSVFFKIGDKIWKLSIINESYRLKFQWNNYEIDSNFQQPLEPTGFDYCCFKTLMTEKLDPKKKCSLPYLLGFLQANNINLLQRTVLNIIPIYFQMHNNLKRTASQISNEMEKNETSVKYNVLLEKDGKTLSPDTTQALMVEYKKSNVKIHSLNRQITKLKKQIEQLEKELEKTNIDYNEADLLESKITNAIEFAQLGSTILISTKQYLLLVLIQPCCGCNNNSLKNKILNITIVEFQIKSTIECQQCDTIFEHINEAQDISLTKAVVVSGLSGGISHNAVQNSFAIMGITNQISNKTYYCYQKICFDSLVTAANSCTEEALKKCIEHALSQGKKVLAVGFDCSWSHVQNANQA
ncbi:39099_t:CDS:2, partial [Gigaspora margarita]